MTKPEEVGFVIIGYAFNLLGIQTKSFHAKI